MHQNNKIVQLILINSLIWIVFANKITLNQGAVVGLKMFPETSRSPIFAFLGIPYAEPPINDLRFALPQPHKGWNGTLNANTMKPICLQLMNSIYSETPDNIVPRGIQMDEDCLYLNIWTPEVGLRLGNLPVVFVITGEEMSFDWHIHRPSGIDLAPEGVIIVHVQYRTNIFGWLGANTAEFPGNFAIADQKLALQWIQENIENFGGNRKDVTVLGHGTSGVTCALLHLSRSDSKDLFSKLILMSGAGLTFRLSSDQSVSQKIIKKLGCQGDHARQILNCLRMKSIHDLEKSFEVVYQNGNYSEILGPVIDTFASKGNQLVPDDLYEILKLGKLRKLPILIGLCSNEAAFMRNYWMDLARNGYDSLKMYINYSILPLLLRKYLFLHYTGEREKVIKAIDWKYFQSTKPRSATYMLKALLRLLSEAEFEAPFYSTIELLARANADDGIEDNFDLFVYSFQTSNSVDLRGKQNLFGGASHSSDLPFLMGPNLFQQIARRRFTQAEEKLCRYIRQLFTNFIKTGKPSIRGGYDSWQPFTVARKFIKILGSYTPIVSTFDENFHEIEELLQKNRNTDMQNYRNAVNPYEIAASTENRRVSTGSSYQLNRQNYEYYDKLRETYAFWNILLPSIYDRSLSERRENQNSADDVKVVKAEVLDCNRFKYAFFWMLGLVFFLLGSLGICVYVLRRDYPGWQSDL